MLKKKNGRTIQLRMSYKRGLPGLFFLNLTMLPTFIKGSRKLQNYTSSKLICLLAYFYKISDKQSMGTGIRVTHLFLPICLETFLLNLFACKSF